MDTSFGNRDGLLLHGLVDGDLVFDVHLVEFVDAADAMVCKHQGSCFDAELSCFGVSPDIGSQSSSATSSAATVDCSRKELTDVLEELTFCSSRISNYANIDVASQLNPIVGLLLDTAKQLQQYALLHIQMAMHRRCN